MRFSCVFWFLPFRASSLSFPGTHPRCCNRARCCIVYRQFSSDAMPFVCGALGFCISCTSSPLPFPRYRHTSCVRFRFASRGSHLLRICIFVRFFSFLPFLLSPPALTCGAILLLGTHACRLKFRAFISRPAFSNSLSFISVRLSFLDCCFLRQLRRSFHLHLIFLIFNFCVYTRQDS